MMKQRRNGIFVGVWFLVKLYWKYQKSAILFLLAGTILGGVMPFAGIIFPKFIIDELTGAQDIYNILFYVAVMLVCILFGNTLVNFFQTKFFLNGSIVFNKFEKDLAQNLYEADLENVEAASFLDLEGKAHKFLYADGQGFGGVLRKAADVFSHFITLAGIVSIISILNPLVVLIFIVLTLITTWFNAKIKKTIVQLSLEQPIQERWLSYDKSLFSEYKFAKEIRVNTMGPWLLQRLWERCMILWGFYKKSNYNYLKIGVFSNVITFIQQGVAYGYLIYSVIKGAFGIGSFTMYLSAIISFSSSMFALMDSFVDIRRFSDYFDAVDEYLNMPKRQREGRSLPLTLSANPVIEFKNVSFRYPNQGEYTLKHINLVIKGGEKLSIVGENGAGKTTFTKLLMRLYKPTEGWILLNGIDIQDYAFDDYVKAISVVFQDFVLFAMSLKENVSIGREVPDEKITEALRQSGFAEKLSTLGRDINTSLYKTFDETGIEPSGGEGQRIALARALLKDAPIVILDEPTAALDPRAEYEIYMNFNKMVTGKTALFISHRLSSSRFCDKIAVFKHGEIVEYGSHTELMEKKGLYRELFTMQARFYEEDKGGAAEEVK